MGECEKAIGGVMTGLAGFSVWGEPERGEVKGVRRGEAWTRGLGMIRLLCQGMTGLAEAGEDSFSNLELIRYI